MSINDRKPMELRDLIRLYFQERPCLHTGNTDIENEIKRFAQNKALESFQISHYNIMSELWDMVMERIIEPKWSGGITSTIVGFQLTKYGEQLLNGLPIDRPNEYIQILESQVPSIDSQIIVYVKESLHSYNLGCYFAASVMLGVASERLFELLIASYINKFPNAQKLFIGKGISKQHTVFITKLSDIVGPNGIKAQDDPSTRRIREDFKYAIEITFNSIRAYRDYAAHPRDSGFPRHMIEGNLNAFVLFCQNIYQVIKWLKNK